MKTKIVASLIALTALAATPALAQEQQAAAPAESAAMSGLSVEKTPISEIIKNEKAKTVIETALPPISQYYDQIGAMTLAQVAPMSNGALDDAKLKDIQAEFDKLNAVK